MTHEVSLVLMLVVMGAAIWALLSYVASQPR